MTAQLTQHFPKGVLLRLSAVFTDAQDVLTDPTTITVQTLAPLGDPVQLVYGEDAALIRDSIGTYYTDVDADADGTWWYRWEGGGALQAVGEHKFIIDPSHF